MITQVIQGIWVAQQRRSGSGVRAVPIIEADGSATPLRPRYSAAPGKNAPTTEGAAPPSPSVRARDELTRESLAKRTQIEPDGVEAEIAERLMERQREASRAHARLLADVAKLWVDRADTDLRDDREEMDLVAAIALRTTTSYAGTQLRDAHIALTDLPETYARLAAGVMPVEWFDRLVRAVRSLTAAQRAQVDERVATWDLASIPTDTFRRQLNLLIAWFPTADDQPSPESRRDVALEGPPEADGTACVRITGPVPELMSFTRRLDQSARAVQDQQRRALTSGAPVPFDPEGIAAASGKPLPLSALRYAIITSSVLDTGTIEVPAERFRINVVVPVMSLLGISEAPATLDGVTPIPAAMARKLAAKEPTWHRILSDPVDGSFLPLPADQYRPTKPMLEYLRLADPVCAMPGCDRATSCNCEGDHIISFNHATPEHGGRTCVGNLHLLCRTHHRLKTLGLLDVARLPAHAAAPGVKVLTGAANSTAPRDSRNGDPPGGTDPPGAHDPPGRTRPEELAPPDDPSQAVTRWLFKKSLQVQVAANRDLLTPELAAALHEAWEEYQWLQHVDAMFERGDVDRMYSEDGPQDPALEEPNLAFDALGRHLDLTPPF